MKIQSDEIQGGIMAYIVILITAIFDYLNASTVQAVINASCALLVTMILKRAFVYIRHKKIKKRRSVKNDIF